MTISRRIQFAVGLVALGLSIAPPAHAYLDPGTGSYVLQVAMASILGAAFAVKTYWMNLKMFFANLFKKKNGN